MDKASRVERIGKALQSITTALKAKDLEELPADVLLKLQLRYEEALRAEYTESSGELFTEEKIDFDAIIKALTGLYRKQESGQLTPAQAKAQLATISSILTANNMKESAEWNHW